MYTFLKLAANRKLGKISKMWKVTHNSRLFKNSQKETDYNNAEVKKSIKNLWGKPNKEIKINMLRTCIFPLVTSRCELWMLSQSLKIKIRALNVLQKDSRNTMIKEATATVILWDVHIKKAGS